MVYVLRTDDVRSRRSRRWLQPGSRRWRLILVAALAVSPILAMASSMITTRDVSEQTVRQHAQTSMDVVASTVADRIQDFLTPAERSARLTGELVTAGSLRVDDSESLEIYFIAELRTNPELSGAFIGLTDGSFVFSSRTDTGLRTKIITVGSGGTRTVELIDRTDEGEFVGRRFDPEDDYDPRSRPWYTRAVEAETQTWTDPYMFFSSGRPGITSAVPLTDSRGQVIGVAGVDVEIAGLSEVLDTATVGERTNSVVVDSRGVVVAVPDYEALLAERDSDALPTVIELDRPLLLTLSSSLDSGAPTINRFDVDGEDFLANVREVVAADTTWSLAVAAPESQFTEAIQNRFDRSIIDMVLVAGAIVILAVAAGIGLSGGVVRLRRRAETDSLTGLLDRREFMLRATDVLREPEPDTQIGLVMLDLDGFKAVNDEHGHVAGDHVLVEAASRLRVAVREEDPIARLGGDEFALLLVAPDADELAALAERVRASLVSEPYVAMSGLHTIGATAGLAIARREDLGRDAMRLIARADEALVKGKTRGKNRLHVAGDMEAVDLTSRADRLQR